MKTVAWILIVAWVLANVMQRVCHVNPLKDRPKPYLVTALLYEWAALALAAVVLFS